MAETEDRDFGTEAAAPEAVPQRTFLCVVDESEELHQALRYACRRAKSTGGRVALLYVIEPVEFQRSAKRATNAEGSSTSERSRKSTARRP